MAANEAKMKKRRELNEKEKLLYNMIEKSDVAEVIRVLNDEGVHASCVDEHGMSPLEHAAYRGKREVCEILLDRGADVNSNEHDQRYTALMFAALSGNTEVVSLLLAAGASTSSVNAVGRNAAQMAAFVGNHECVSVINNWVPLKEVEYYAEIHSDIEKEPRLPRNLVAPLHRLLSTTNVHPVAIALYLQLNSDLIVNSTKVTNVLRSFCDKEAKKNEANEVLALKFHFFGHSIEACCKMVDNISKKKGCSSSDALDDVIRHWLKKADDGTQNLERFVRQGIREFPYPHFPLIPQLVRTVASSKASSTEDDGQSALALVTATVCGQRMGVALDDIRECATCGTRKKTAKKCSACKSVYYCQQKCQKLHWFVHKTDCRRLGEEYRANEELEQRMRRAELEADEKNGSNDTKLEHEAEKELVPKIEEVQSEDGEKEVCKSGKE